VDIGLRAAELLRLRQEEVAAWVVHEGGRTWEEALADVEEAIDHINWNSLEVRRLSSQIKSAYKPRGVVACIPPWNFPTALPAAMTSAALITGNAVILKSAEQTPIIAQHLVDAFHEAGVPRDALIHLPGAGETVGARLVESPDVDMVAFTGSKRVGLWIYQAASSVIPNKGGIKRVVAEMGGKNAIIVFPDADMDEAVTGVLHSAFGHAGQKCSACSRVLVHREVYDRFTQRLVEAARSLPIGASDQPGTVINPIIDMSAKKRIIATADEARTEGRVLLDLLECEGTGGACVGPLIVEVPTEDAGTAVVAQEEIFGPILPLIPFNTDEEAF
jgi:RHH-type proline utilization regulon transcriptional repressor/proline dehydrogenase/delta 1-pyrroline-5-carboxylate dehydrogenase